MTFLGLIKVAVAVAGGMVVGVMMKQRGMRRDKEMPVDSGCVTKQSDINARRSKQSSAASVVDAEDTEIFKLKDRVVALERENGILKRENEVLRVKLDETQCKIEVSFPKLVKRLYLMSGNPEIKAILEENGLSFYTNFADFQDGFMRIRNESVTEAVLVRAALVRGDDLVEPGIVYVPMSEAGAAPPISLRDDVESATGIVSVEPISADENTKAASIVEDNENFHDDFVVD